MKLFRLLVLPLALLAATHAQAAEESAAPQGYRAEILRNVSDVESKITELAQATSQEKLGYRPGADVRTAGEVFLHVATANYLFPSFMGVKTPEGIDLMKLEKSITDKAELEKTLKASFEHLRGAIRGLPDNDWERSVDLFGKPVTLRAACLTMVSHLHEHLGQSIAYARGNGVVPPWTARAQEAKQKKTSGM